MVLRALGLEKIFIRPPSTDQKTLQKDKKIPLFSQKLGFLHTQKLMNLNILVYFNMLDYYFTFHSGIVF